MSPLCDVVYCLLFILISKPKAVSLLDIAAVTERQRYRTWLLDCVTDGTPHKAAAQSALHKQLLGLGNPT